MAILDHCTSNDGSFEKSKARDGGMAEKRLLKFGSWQCDSEEDGRMKCQFRRRRVNRVHRMLCYRDPGVMGATVNVIKPLTRV
jgi:hypothetical protein